MEAEGHRDDHASARESVTKPRRRVSRSLFRILVMLLAVYAGLCVLVSVFQSKLVYVPYRTMEGTPADEGMVYEDVTLRAADGVTLKAWWAPAGNARATVLICHGNAGNISHRVGTMKLFHDLGLNVFIFDYRGYGMSDGAPTEEGTYLDADAAWRYVTETRGVSPERLFIFGRSLGGAVAAHLAASRASRAVILESTFTSVPDLGAQIYPFLPVRAICRINYNTKAIIRNIGPRLLLIHSPEDDIIPFSHGEALREARLGLPTEFLEITGDHNWGWQVSGPLYVNGLRDFISDELGAPRTPPERESP